ncbi:histidine kinase [Bacillus mobilis]|uniref:Histidine kinase n=2 Tax=Bacillus cereus group TaxID=86661 RepID=A0A1C4E924_BACCE|nr:MULTISPECIES: histidine kinase [Bacillus cereus group]MCC2463456.1 histidine kinase [Bacillus mobilis]MCU5435228.1 histidine kinase [Bacillus mobilis]MCU5594328.1 histidine kinase [Bacillus mobilis]MCU5737941.1 histidine kinase [Bacillus mobilis]MCU9560235.1 histidine kinase [Bacillus mobilis]
MRIKLLSILFLLFLTSCSPLKNNEIAIVEPYKLTEEQSSILQMTPFQEGNSMFYSVTLKNEKDEIHATIDYYQNGKKTNEIVNTATSHFPKKKVKLSFLPPQSQLDKDIQAQKHWYVNIEGSFMLVPEEAPPSINSSASTTLQSAINLKYNQKTTLAAIIKTNKETVRVPILEEKTAIDQLLQENEHVYLFSIELKKAN